MRNITEIVGISVDRMHTILHKELEKKFYFPEIKKLCARWVPSIDQKCMQKDFAAVFIDA